MTANDGGDADAALVRRFRQAQTRQESAAVFAGVVRQHRDAVLARCAERLWPDADAAVAAAGDVFIAASLALADPAKLARPDLLRAWLAGIAAHGGLTSGQPARIDDIDWAALQAGAATGVSGPRDSSATRAQVRRWLDQIVTTLPEPRQRLYDLFVTKGLNSRDAALELGSDAAEVQRLRRENQQAILRAFEVTALAAAETAPDPGNEAPGCEELRQILADAPHDGDPREDGRRHIAVLPAALRLAVTRHLSQCGTCQEHRDDCMAWWAPGLLPVLAGAELSEQVMEDLRHIAEFGPRAAPGAHRRAAPAGTFGNVFTRRAATTGGGLLAVLLLLAFVWPGFLHGTEASVRQGSTVPSAQDPSSSRPSTPQVTGEIGGVPSRDPGRQVSGGVAGALSSPPQAATGSPTAPSPSASSPSASRTPPMRSTVQPTIAPTSPATRATSAPASTRPTSSPSAKPPSPSAPQPTPTSSPSTSTPATPAPSTSAPATPASTTPASATPAATTSDPSTSEPTPSASTTPASATPAVTTSDPSTSEPTPSALASSTVPSTSPSPSASASASTSPSAATSS
jgi:DNA-directed RNA polymerase specialized sigma24 family protein